jgi:ankyrin repeat protein
MKMPPDLDALCRAALRGEIAQMTSALTAGVPVNAQDADGKSALHWAVWGGQEESVRLLLDHGADPNLHSSDAKHATPYWHAAEE